MKRKRGLQGLIATRAAPLPEGTLDVQARTFELTIASEEPVRRYHWDLGDFDEVLVCTPEAVDLSRMSPDAACPLLENHEFRMQVGVIDSASVDAAKVRGIARAQRSPAGDQLLTDVADRVRRNVSVGYQIFDVELHEKEGERPRVVVTRWQPFEVSIVAAGADPTVGIGRSNAEQYPDVIVRKLRGAKMKPKKDGSAAGDQSTGDDDSNPTPRIDVTAVREEARKAEQERVREIAAIGARFDLRDAADKAVHEGTELEVFRSAALDAIELRQKKKAETTTLVDLPGTERKTYSVGRAVAALMQGRRELAPLEFEVSDAYRAKGVQAKNERSIYVPLSFLRPRAQDRSLVASLQEMLGLRAAISKGGSGGNLIGTDFLGEEYVPHLLSDLVLVQAGARLLPGLVGDIEIPAGSGSYGTAQHVTTETANAPEVAPTLRQIPGVPHTIAAYTDFTRRMRLQSIPAIESIVRTGLSDAINELVERSGINGAGSGGAPTGVYLTSGIVASDFSGFTYADWIRMWAAIKNAKGTGARLSYITSYGVAAKAMTTTRGGTGSDIMIATMSNDGNVRVDGFPVYPTQESPQAFGSPAVLHGVAFGDWTKVVIAQWGEGVEITVDEAALSLSGGRRVIAHFDYDILVTLGQSFAIADNVSAS